jgi:S-DNA-T family DNA segregation ATPase FtsK/SpoIIIE
VVWIDELRHYTDCPGRETRKQINSKLIELASVGPATGILPVFATQRPSGEVVPTDLRDLIPVRWALACSTSAASDMVLGQGAASQGSNAAELDRERKGVGILVGTGARSITLRSMLIEVDGMRRVAEEATKLRRAAGMLPTGRPGRPEAPAILGSILSALEAGEGVEAMRTAELIDVLRQANPAQWGDLDAVSLATKVRPWGLGPRQLGQFGGENNPRGYRLTDVQQAIAVATGKAG